jgi:gliding motility-associated-like protein
MKKFLTLILIAFISKLNAQCDMEIIEFNPETLDISIAVISAENCGLPTDSIGEFLLGITTEPQLEELNNYDCFYDNGWALLVLPVDFVLVDINAPGPYLQSGDTITFNIIDAFIGGSDASLCWQEVINDGFFEDYCWKLAITQINDSHPWPFENGTGLGGFDYPDVTPENNMITFSPFNPDCNSLDTGEPNPDCPTWTTLHIPNVFTPNNDGENDVWKIVYDFNCWENIEFWIFNRWGNEIYHAYGDGYDSYPFWDGSVNGRDHYVSDGVYMYIVQGKKRNSVEVVKKTGHITIFR